MECPLRLRVSHDLLLTARNLSRKILGAARRGREKNSGIVGLWDSDEIAISEISGFSIDFPFQKMAKIHDFKGTPFDFSRFPGVLERGEPSRPGKQLGDCGIVAKSRFLKFPDFRSISIFEKCRKFSFLSFSFHHRLLLKFAISKVPFDFSRFPGILERGEPSRPGKTVGNCGIYAGKNSYRQRILSHGRFQNFCTIF